MASTFLGNPPRPVRRNTVRSSRRETSIFDCSFARNTRTRRHVHCTYIIIQRWRVLFACGGHAEKLTARVHTLPVVFSFFSLVSFLFFPYELFAAAKTVIVSNPLRGAYFPVSRLVRFTRTEKIVGKKRFYTKIMSDYWPGYGELYTVYLCWAFFGILHVFFFFFYKSVPTK